MLLLFFSPIFAIDQESNAGVEFPCGKEPDRYRIPGAALEAGVSFYDSGFPGLGRDFALGIRLPCHRISDSHAAGFEVKPDIRRRILHRFPSSESSRRKKWILTT